MLVIGCNVGDPPPQPLKASGGLGRAPAKKAILGPMQFGKDAAGNALFSRVAGKDYSIDWKGVGSAGVDPLEILTECKNRMEFLQSTPQGSDANARALIEVMEAIDALKGTNEVSAPIEGSGFIDSFPGSETDAPGSPSDQ